MRSPSEAPAVTRPVCGNIYTGVASTRPLLRPCTPLRGSRSLPRFLEMGKTKEQVESVVHLIRLLKHKIYDVLANFISLRKLYMHSGRDCSNVNKRCEQLKLEILSSNKLVE